MNNYMLAIMMSMVGTIERSTFPVTSADEIRQLERMEWNAAAPGWKKYGKGIFESTRPVSDQLIRSCGIASGHTVLDVATGAGEPALTIAKIVGPHGRVVGVDLSPEMLAVAKERAASQGITNVAFQVIEDETLSIFEDNTFDSVVCQNGLMFMPDPMKALKAFLRVLKPGGRASVTVWGSPEKASVMMTFFRTMSKHLSDLKTTLPGTPGGPFGIPSINMLHNYFSNAGFSNFNAQTIEFTFAEAKTAEEFWQGMTEVSGLMVILLSKLPDNKKQAIKDDAMQSLSKIFRSGGPFRFTGDIILGTGTKKEPLQQQQNQTQQ
jgi:ubiquinone/menaquinone biosynthesis C-methylase UbiE